MKTIDNWLIEIRQAALEKAEASKRLEAANRRLVALIDEQIGTDANESQAPVNHALVVAGANGDDGSTSEKILALFQSEPTKRWRYQEIANRVPGPKLATIRSLLYRLDKSGKVSKAGRGKYKAVPIAEQVK